MDPDENNLYGDGPPDDDDETELTRPNYQARMRQSIAQQFASQGSFPWLSQTATMAAWGEAAREAAAREAAAAALQQQQYTNMALAAQQLNRRDYVARLGHGEEMEEEEGETFVEDETGAAALLARPVVSGFPFAGWNDHRALALGRTPSLAFPTSATAAAAAAAQYSASLNRAQAARRQLQGSRSAATKAQVITIDDSDDEADDETSPPDFWPDLPKGLKRRVETDAPLSPVSPPVEDGAPTALVGSPLVSRAAKKQRVATVPKQPTSGKNTSGAAVGNIRRMSGSGGTASTSALPTGSKQVSSVRRSSEDPRHRPRQSSASSYSEKSQQHDKHSEPRSSLASASHPRRPSNTSKSDAKQPSQKSPESKQRSSLPVRRKESPTLAGPFIQACLTSTCMRRTVSFFHFDNA